MGMASTAIAAEENRLTIRLVRCINSEKVAMREEMCEVREAGHC